MFQSSKQRVMVAKSKEVAVSLERRSIWEVEPVDFGSDKIWVLKRKEKAVKGDLEVHSLPGRNINQEKEIREVQV